MTNGQKLATVQFLYGETKNKFQYFTLEPLAKLSDAPLKNCISGQKKIADIEICKGYFTRYQKIAPGKGKIVLQPMNEMRRNDVSSEILPSVPLKIPYITKTL